MLSDEQREALMNMTDALIFAPEDIDIYDAELLALVERIASDASRAAERALVEDLNELAETYNAAAEALYPGGVSNLAKRAVYLRVRDDLRSALRPEAATTERHWDECLHGVTLGSVCLDCPSKWASIPARPAATTEGAVCKHCGRRIENNMHAEGRQRGLGRCDTADSGLPYGYEAEGAGEPCSIACRGSSKLAEGDAAAVHPDTEGAVEQEGAHFACCDLPDGGCGGCGNCPEHCVCDRPCGYCIAARAARGEGEPT